MGEPPKIKKLDEVVINRIAAGEVIQRPANALKELIENCLDAKSTNIQITVKNGGLKLLQIQDNGTGIRKEDFEIVCERFTTSKLQEFEDLNSISTYGFRGEALASISHVAHLTIVSKTADEKCAFKSTYEDGKLKGAIKPIAGNQGTQITVEDLFYNMNIRKNALRSPAEEYQKIADVVGKYSIHNATTGFSLRKQGESNDIRTPPKSTVVDNIRTIYGNTIARELIEFEHENEQFKFKVDGHMTNVNYSSKKMQFILFINHRLVECQNTRISITMSSFSMALHYSVMTEALLSNVVTLKKMTWSSYLTNITESYKCYFKNCGLKRCIDQIYTTYLPKNMHPFLYLSLQIEPSNIDVNVHPTKHEVHFLNEEQIIDIIKNSIETKLLGSNNCRVFYTQAKLPGVIDSNMKVTDNDKTPNKPIYDKDLVRTDANEQKLEKFFGPTTKKVRSSNNLNITAELDANFEEQQKRLLERNMSCEGHILDATASGDVDGPSKPEHGDASASENDLTSPNKRKLDCSFNKKQGQKKILSIESIIQQRDKIIPSDLKSIQDLQQEIIRGCHEPIRDIFEEHVFVGSVNARQALIQRSTKLYLCDTAKIMKELFYQFVLFHFNNFNAYTFSQPIPLIELAKMALDLPETGWTPEDGEKSELAEKIAEILTEKGDMLNEYFSMEIDTGGNLKSIPIIIDKHLPEMRHLPMYILRLATEVNWDDEKSCFESFSRETAQYYSQLNEDNDDYKHTIEHVLYPIVKEYFIPSKAFAENGALLQIADLPNLYKVFERC